MAAAADVAAAAADVAATATAATAVVVVGLAAAVALTVGLGWGCGWVVSRCSRSRGVDDNLRFLYDQVESPHAYKPRMFSSFV